MEEIKNMLKAFMNSQSAFNQKIEKELSDVKDIISKKIADSERRLTKRIDSIGKSLAYIEEDTPTMEEFDDLKRDVELIKKKINLPFH